MVKKKLEWLIGVVGPTNIAISCRLVGTKTLYEWADGVREPDNRSCEVVEVLYRLFIGLLSSGFDKTDIVLFYHSLNDDFDGCSPAVFMRESDPKTFEARFFSYFSREKMERAAGAAFSSAQNYGLTVEEIKNVLKSGSMRELLEICSLTSAVYHERGVEEVLRKPYAGVSELSPIDLLQKGTQEDLSRVKEITERLRKHV